MHPVNPQCTRCARGFLVVQKDGGVIDRSLAWFVLNLLLQVGRPNVVATALSFWVQFVADSMSGCVRYIGRISTSRIVAGWKNHVRSQRNLSSHLAGTSYFSRGESGATTFIPAAPRWRPSGIDAKEFTSRRDKLMGLLRTDTTGKCDQFLVFIAASKVLFMAEDVPYPFRQNSDFRYLCGVTEPNCLLVLHSLSPSEYRCHIFVPKVSPSELPWDGPGLDAQTVILSSGVDSIRFVTELEDFLQNISKSLYKIPFGVYYDPNTRFVNTSAKSTSAFFPKLDDWFMQRPGNCKLTGVPTSSVQQCRLVKSPAEMDLIRHAAQISSRVIKETIRRTRPGMREVELGSILEYESVFNGADRLAYPPVVASGSRALTIHYIRNSEVMKDGDMVLVDCGSEVEGYCSDITRTWPVSSDFTPAQRILYEIVHKVHTSIFDLLRKLGNDYTNYPTLDDLYGFMLDLLADQLKRHLLMPQSTPKKEERALVLKQFCIHHLGHYLGMDIHDCTLVSRGVKLQQGMVLALEPGLYIDLNNTSVVQEFRGNGIRIEDVIWLGPNGPEVLSKDCPTSAQDILQLRKS